MTNHNHLQRVLAAIGKLIDHYDNEGMMVDCLADNLEALYRVAVSQHLSQTVVFETMADDIIDAVG